MGAYLYFKTESNPKKVMDYLYEDNQLNKNLEKMEEQTIWLCDSDHLEWVKNNRPDLLDMEKEQYAQGSLKTSGGISEKMEEAGWSYEDVAEMWVQIFEELNKRFEMKYYANSCSLNPESEYFTIDQMKRITKNGELLSGKSSKSERARELYEKYYKLFSEPEKEVFDISILKERDEVLIDGNWIEIERSYTQTGLKLEWAMRIPASLRGARIDEELAPRIEGYKKFIPKIRYGGSTSDVEAYVLDNGTLIYLESIGTENMVKAITSVLMQGRMKMNDHTVDATFGYFKINKAGNKRKIIPLENGLAHAITYHSPTIADAEFSVLIGEDDDQVMERFQSWMENTNHLPYPQNLVKEIYTELVEREQIEILTSYGVKAIKLLPSIMEDEAVLLQEIIIKVCKDNGVIAHDAKPLKAQAPLPKSQYLREEQVQKIFDTLNKMPKTYELEDMEIKPIGLKLFSPNMTLYITEADRGCESDEFENMHTQCYGYVVNEYDPQLSEWGYINVPAYLEVVYENGVGFEQDLYFEDMYIDSRGNIGKKEDLEKDAS